MNLAKQHCLSVIKELKNCHKERWAEIFVARRIQFARLWSGGLIFSTSHGADFFDNVVACLDGKEWDEKGYLGDNFRKLIKELTAAK